MSAAQDRARELLAYYDSCRAREAVPAVTADTTSVIRDLLAELDQARGLLRDARRHEMVYRNEKWSDEVPPGGVVCNECEEPVETEPCYLHGAGMDVANSLRTRIFDVLAERDAALATLAEVREWARHARLTLGDQLGIDAILDRVPR